MRRLILAAFLAAPFAANAGETVIVASKQAFSGFDCSKAVRYYPMEWSDHGETFLRLNADGSWTVIDRQELRHARITMPAFAPLFNLVLHKEGGARIIDESRSDVIALAAGHHRCMLEGSI